jgi:UDP-galactopyranose mutase
MQTVKRALVIGSGLTGSTAAWKLASEGWEVRIHEAELVVGGHVRTSEFNGLLYEQNAIHVFHTENEKVFNFLRSFVDLIDYKHIVLTEIDGKTLTWPLQLNELKSLSMWRDIEDEITQLPPEPDMTNFETYAISIMGGTLYKLFVEPYTVKQWGRDPKLLSASFAPKRIGLRTESNKPIFMDRWQGWPNGGWTNLIDKILSENPIEIVLGRSERATNIDWEKFDAVIVTAPLDDFLELEQLPWRGVRVEHHIYPKQDGCRLESGQVNHPGLDAKYTRRTETKWMSGQRHTHTGTIVTYEFPSSNQKHYPIDDAEGVNRKYANFLKSKLKLQYPNAITAGRLANYVYINTDQAIMQGLNAAESAIKNLHI